MVGRGVLVFAHNNELVDYGSQAVAAALMARRNMGVPTMLVTDPGTIFHLENVPWEHRDAFDIVHVLEYDRFRIEGNQRKYRDSPWTIRMAGYHNGSRHLAYELSPWDETLLIDADYLIQNSTLGMVWGSRSPLMINRDIVPLDRNRVMREDLRLDTMSVPLCWATVVYFRKSPEAALFFDLVSHIRTNYEFYSLVYGYPRLPYRNDYAFSIAAHMVNGFSETGEIPPLPVPRTLTSIDGDVLVDVPGVNRLRFLVNDSRENWRNVLSNCDGINVHCMNKLSLSRMVPKLVETYR